MVSKYKTWARRHLVTSICNRLQNKFDVFIVLEGNRGLGKSTLGIHLMRDVRREMKKRGIKGYEFRPKRDLLYTRDEVIKYFTKWRHSGMADEMINVSFNRDYQNEKQKDIIKLINMNRDHNNFFIACVPRFKTLDNQIKNLCSMKITIVRRGLGLIHRPNKTVYSSDIWDEAFNEKIEREWLKKNIQRPAYSRLTTFKGLVKFPKLSPKLEELYQEIKDQKRNKIAEEEMEIKEKEKPLEPIDKIYKDLTEYKIQNAKVLEGMAYAFDMTPSTVKNKLKRMLENDRKPTGIAQYYSDNTGRYKDKFRKKID